MAADARVQSIRQQARKALHDANPGASVNDSYYMFTLFIINFLPHGLIGLLVAVVFAAALSSKAAELNALGATTTIDIYRHLVNRQASDAHFVAASKFFTVLWG